MLTFAQWRLNAKLESGTQQKFARGLATPVCLVRKDVLVFADDW
jgi:hypothetical protein